MSIPRFQELLNPTLQVIKKLGDSASISELDEEMIRYLNLSDEDASQLHNSEGGDGRTELQYRLAWARTYLKIYDVLENSKRKIWVLTPKGKEIDKVDPLDVVRSVRNSIRESRTTNGKFPKDERATITDAKTYDTDTSTVEALTIFASEETGELLGSTNWRSELLSILQDMKFDNFERLCQRILRESGFVEVKITGKTGDGGIDGTGIIKLNGLLSFPIIFQCKRYKGNIGSPEMRNFRGAMAGRTDRGLFMTTGTFSQAAKREANRDGVPPIDLIDGEMVLDKLRELKLGIEIKIIEEVSILRSFFNEI